MTNNELQNMTATRDGPSASGLTPQTFSRRGTIMVFVLGVLTLLALVGLVLIARTHGESQRMKMDSVALSSRSVMNGIVRTVQETLRQDIWGPNPDPNYPLPLNNQSAGNFRESNEPFDAPGPRDRWLASSTPYMITDDNGIPIPQVTGIGATPPPPEDGVLAWKWVSYLGIDLLNPNGIGGQQPFAWGTNSRNDTPTLVRYNTNNLRDIKVLQTPPASIPGNLIPGSTTNVTIADARPAWEAGWTVAANVTAFQNIFGPTASPRFPYFDTNADGAVDLYDADGDGVPDSPISFVVPVDTANPNSPKNLYAVVRIVDHGGKLNVNVASSLLLPSGTGSELMFDESLPGLQRRGTRMTELLFDDTVHLDDRFDPVRAMVGARAGDDPVAYDENVVRRVLAGGTPTGINYFLYGPSEEASLRHRGMLVPYDRRRERAAAGTDYRTIDRALPGTLAWSRDIDDNGSYIGGDAIGDLSRWTRLNSNFADGANYEGYGSAEVQGWRWMMRGDEPYAIRRPLFTTISREVTPPPPGVLFDQANGDRVVGLPVTQVRFADPPNNVYTMDWPVIDNATWPDVADWLRVLTIDLNMRSPSALPSDTQLMKEKYITYLAGAMYKALEGVQAYQGQWVQDNPATALPTDETLNRQYYAWQFAVNAADYRDTDNTPTIVEWPVGQVPPHYIYGVEKQPFFTEAYAYLTAGTGSGPSGPSQFSQPQTADAWFCAVELFVPPYWRIPTVDPNNPSQPVLYLNVPGSAIGMIPVNTFQRIPSGQTLNELYGDPLTGGSYYVFCGATTDAPPTINPSALGFFRNNVFQFDDSGNGEVELVYSPTGNLADPFTHVIDLISPAYSGSPLAGPGTTSGAGDFAKNPGGLPPGSNLAFSLLRSTKGWRFSTGWQVYTKAPSLGPTGDPPMRESLGFANDTSDSLDGFVPPSIWPGRVALNGNTPPDSFGPGQPFEAFDSPVDINHLLTIGTVRRSNAGDPPFLVNRLHNPYGIADVPATILLAETTAMSQIGDGTTDDLSSIYAQRTAMGRVDFVSAKPVGGTPWSQRLLSYLTTRSAVFDGIDNDGDGAFDLSDPTEAAKVLQRVAGRININTAPAAVLRSVPFMSLLPTSVEFLAQGAPSGDPVVDFSDAAFAGLFYDMASAIISAREARSVPVRLPDGAGGLQTVATAKRAAVFPPDAPGASGYFTSVAELERLTHIIDAVAGNNAQFRADRFNYQPGNASLSLYNHKLIASDQDLGTSSYFSPDFRYRRADNNNNGVFSVAEGDDYVADYVPIVPNPPPAGAFEYSGQRARDMFLARWANMLTVRSDVFTAYIALLDDEGHYVQRCQVTLDRSECFRERPGVSGTPGTVVLPEIVTKTQGSYEEEVH